MLGRLPPFTMTIVARIKIELGDDDHRVPQLDDNNFQSRLPSSPILPCISIASQIRRTGQVYGSMS
jgi:hypothetical protein